MSGKSITRRKFIEISAAAAGALVVGPAILSAVSRPSSTPASKPTFQAPAAGIDRIMLTWSADPATTQSIVWRTGKPCENPQAQFVVSSPDPSFGNGAAAAGAVSQSVAREDGAVVYYHRVDLKGLKPSTVYAYRVGDGTNWDEWNEFRTADTEPAPFKFIYVGDAQTDIRSLCSRVLRTALCAAGEARFILHAGDLVNTANNDDEWGEWFEAGGWVYRAIPSVPVIGNHEQAVAGESHGLSQYWRPQFALPGNGPEGQEGLAYYLKYQGVLIVALNGTRDLEKQAQWLEKVLEGNRERTWTIVSIHQPMFATAWERDSKEIQTAFMSTLDRHKVELVLQGHDHTYGRTHKVAGGEVVDPKADGTVYCTSVEGSKMYAWNPWYQNLMSRKGTRTQLFQVISIDKGTLRYESWTANHELFDSFEIVKNGQGSQLIDKSPQTLSWIS